MDAQSISEFATGDSKEKKNGSIKTVFTIFKSFIGTGILFLPAFFKDGGWLFGSVVLIFSVIISYYCMDLLIRVKLEHGGTFMEIGEKAWGKFGKITADISLALS